MEDITNGACSLLKLTFVIGEKTIEMTLEEAKSLRYQLNSLLGNPVITKPTNPLEPFIPDIAKPYKIERPDVVPWRIDDPYYPYPGGYPLYFTIC